MNTDSLLKIFGAATGVVGLFLALRNQYLTLITHKERATFDMVDKMYSLCYTVQGQLFSNWKLSHLYCIGIDEYQRRVNAIKSTLGDQTEKTSLIQLELNLVIQLLVSYEQVYYQWTCTHKRMTRRRDFLESMLSYYHGRLFENPRILSIINDYKATQELHLEPETLSFLLRNLKLDETSYLDTRGPFQD